jgi:hypothetical protein
MKAFFRASARSANAHSGHSGSGNAHSAHSGSGSGRNMISVMEQVGGQR